MILKYDKDWLLISLENSVQTVSLSTVWSHEERVEGTEGIMDSVREVMAPVKCAD